MTYTCLNSLYSSAVEDDTELQRLLEGCTDDWKLEFKDRKMTNWDARHWMSNMGSMLATATGSPLSNLFGVLLPDALFTILPGEYHRVKHYLLTQRNLSHDVIGSIKRAFWRRNCKYSCEEPKILVERLYFVYKFFCSINNPHRENGKVLVGNHRDIFYKEIKHVQQGLLSDPPNMIMYVEVPRISAKGRQRNLGLTRYRCLRNTSALEASFLHLRASVHPCGKSVGLPTLHVRLNMWDWSWNTRALQVSGEIPNIGHPWLWVVDQLADVCTGSDMFPDGAVLPVTLRQWTRTKTALKSCTIRGVDWEVLKARNLFKSNGVRVSPLTDEDTVKIVLKFPDLVKTNDWVQLEKASGIRTNTFALEAMRQRCTDVALQCPDLEGRGLPTLRAKLRSTAPEAPRSVHRPPTLSPNLGTASPLPLAQVPGSPSAVTGTIDQLEMEIDPNSHTHSETSRKRGGGSRGGKSGAERIRDFRNNQTPEEKEKEKQKDRDRKKAKRGGGASG